MTLNQPTYDVQSRYVVPTEEQLRDARSIVERFAQKWARPPGQSAEVLRDLMHPDTRNLIPPMTEPSDQDGVVSHFAEVFRRLPDLQIEVLRWAPTGDAVMIEWGARATVFGTPMYWTGVDRFNVRGDRMYEANVYWDTNRVSAKLLAAAQAASKATRES